MCIRDRSHIVQYKALMRDESEIYRDINRGRTGGVASANPKRENPGVSNSMHKF